MNRLGVVIVCRSSNEPLKPGNKVGFQCAFCGARLQVSPGGIANKEKYPQAKFVCNPCGLKYAALAKELGILDRAEMSEVAKAQYEKELAKGNPVAKFIQENLK